MNTTCCKPTTPQTEAPKAPAKSRPTVPRHHLGTLPENAGWELRVELPGVSKDALKITLEKGELTIEASRSGAIPENWRPVGAASVSSDYRLDLSLREDLIASDEVTASLENGILNLRFPSRREVQPRVVPVN